MPTVGPDLPPLSPSREEFRALAGRGNVIPVYAEMAADLDTPLSAFLRLRPGPYAFLLESVEGGEKWARYSFLGSDPLMVFTAKGSRISLRHADGHTELLPSGNPFESLRALLARFKPVPVPGLPRFQGGAVGFLSYDMVRHVERLPQLAKDDLRLPDAVFMLTDSLLVFDNLRHRLLVIANAHVTKTDPASLDRAYDRGRSQDRHDAGQSRAGPPARRLRSPVPAVEPLVALGEEGFTSTMDQATYMERVRRAKEYIACGRRLSDRASRGGWTPSCRPTRSLSTGRCARSTRRRTSSSCDSGKTTIVGSSPEVLVRLEDDRVEERPIAGTHPRGRTEEEDARLAERDAGRSEGARRARDAGGPRPQRRRPRESASGSVEVSEFMVVERYSHVMHLVSHVRGRARARARTPSTCSRPASRPAR